MAGAAKVYRPGRSDYDEFQDYLFVRGVPTRAFTVSLPPQTVTLLPVGGVYTVTKILPGPSFQVEGARA